MELQDLPRTDNTHQIHRTEAEQSGSNDGSPQTNTHEHTQTHGCACTHTHTHVEAGGHSSLPDPAMSLKERLI